MRSRKRRHNQNQRAKAAERDDKTEQEQQVIDTVENVKEANLHKAPGRLMPARVELNQARIATQLEGTYRPIRRHKPDHRHDIAPEPLESRPDRECVPI